MVESGQNLYIFTLTNTNLMITFIGEYSCKLDSKGRVILPSAFKKQMAGSNPDRFVVKKDIFEKCLVLFPFQEWERQNKILRKKINPYKKEHNKFMRQFFKGMAEVMLDSNNRLLIPKRLLDEVEAEREVIMAGQYGKIEVWAKHLYERIEVGDDEFAGMAESIMEGLVDEPDE
jgi:MraZ protein